MTSLQPRSMKRAVADFGRLGTEGAHCETRTYFGLTPLARLSPTNTTEPSATMASPNKTALAPTPPTSPSAATSPAGTDRIIPASTENRLRINVTKNGRVQME